MTHDGAVVEGDPVVQTALRLLPVPAHADGFWADVDQALLEEVGRRRSGRLHAAPSSAPVPPAAGPIPRANQHLDCSHRLVPPALRRRSNAVAALAAVAAMVLAVVAGTTLIRQRTGSDLSPTALSSSEETTTTTPSAPSSSTGARSGSDEARSSDAVLAWAGALGAGDADATWAALGPDARQHLGTRAALDEMMGELAESFGAWSAVSPDHVLVTPMATGDGGSVAIVTLVGEVHQGGVVEHRADAVAVRLVDDTVQLEPFDVAGAVEIVVPDETAVGAPSLEGDELVVVIPAGAQAPMLRLDDGPAVICGEEPGTELVELDEASGQRCSFTPDGGIEAGRRVLTVAFTAAGSAEISADSVLFEAA